MNYHPSPQTAAPTQRPLNVAGIFSLLFIALNILWSFVLPFIVQSGGIEQNLKLAPWLPAPVYVFSIIAVIFGAIGAPKTGSRMRWAAIGGLVAGLASFLDIAANGFGTFLSMM